MGVLKYVPTLIWLSILVLFVRPSSSSGLDGTLHSRAPKSVFNFRLKTTSRAPEACNCEQVRSKKIGVCYFYTDKDNNVCSSRPCRKSFQCTSVITGLTCMRRRTTTKIVPLARSQYTCRTVRTNGIMYVPYASRPLPRRASLPNRRPSKKKKRRRNKKKQKRRKNKKRKKRKRFFMVVAGESVLGIYPKLSVAKKVLKRFSRKSKRRRAIFEVRNGKVGKDPRRVGGRRNQAGGMRNGFNKFWWNKRDISAMYKTAVGYLMGRTFKKGKPDYFVVVAGKIAFGETRSLREAQKLLMLFGTKSRRGRCIFEVVKGKVGPDPRRIAGKNQAAGLRAGFNTYFIGKKDIARMYKIAVEYTMLRKKFKDPFEDVSGKFIVIVGKKAVGTYRKLSRAKYALMKSKSTQSTQQRCIFEVKRGKVNPDPRVISGQAQINGMNAGFNKFWWGISDIRKMYRIAARYNAPK